MFYNEAELIKLSDEHALINEYVLSFKKLIVVDDFPGIAQLLKTMYPFLTKDMDRHFAFEENHFFPAALYCREELDIILLVLTLQKQHGQIRAELEFVLRLIKDTSWVTLGQGMEFKKQLVNFMDNLKRHIKLEMSEFYSFLAHDEKAQQYLKSGV